MRAPKKVKTVPFNLLVSNSTSPKFNKSVIDPPVFESGDKSTLDVNNSALVSGYSVLLTDFGLTIKLARKYCPACPVPLARYDPAISSISSLKIE
jgi:hypothetical protein